jgi:phosphoglycolate phosphatase-like HAD superfamily hydrolase
MHTILFDIDGTLLHSGGAGQAGIERALQVAFGITAPTRGIPVAGRTDRAIGYDLLRYHGLEPTESVFARLRETYLQLLPAELASRQGHTYPGVRDLLARLSVRSDVRLGLLTGNYCEAAWLKLRHYQIADHFSFGGFGDEHSDRDDVARAAFAAATRHHHPHRVAIDRLWVVGDTPADVRCGRAIGARVIAVATGQFTVEELAQSQPDHLFADFSDVEAVLSLWPAL